MALQATAASRAPDNPQAILSFHGMTKRFGGTLAVDGIDLDALSRRDPGAARRERRRQVDADQDAGRRLRRPMPATCGATAQPYDPRKDSVDRLHPPGPGPDRVDDGRREHRAWRRAIPGALGLIDWTRRRAPARGESLRLVGRRHRSRAAGAGPVAHRKVAGRDRPRARRRAPTCWCSTSRPRACRRTRSRPCSRCCARCKARGVGMIYVSHRLDEVFAIADRARGAARRPAGRRASRPRRPTPGELVRLIVGRPPEAVFVRPARQAGEALLRFEGVVAGGVGPLDLAIEARRDRRPRRPARRRPGGGRPRAVRPAAARPRRDQPRRRAARPREPARRDRARHRLRRGRPQRRIRSRSGCRCARTCSSIPAPPAAARSPGGRRPTRPRRPFASAHGSACGRTIRQRRSRRCPAATSRRW